MKLSLTFECPACHDVLDIDAKLELPPLTTIQTVIGEFQTTITFDGNVMLDHFIEARHVHF